MKQLIITLSALMLSAIASAHSSQTLICSSADNKIEIKMLAIHNDKGELVISAMHEGIDLKNIKTSSYAFTTLVGGTEGDMDNYQTYQMTLLPSDSSEQTAVLIEQNHIDRIGYENRVTTLKCNVK